MGHIVTRIEYRRTSPEPGPSARYEIVRRRGVYKDGGFADGNTPEVLDRGLTLSQAKEAVKRWRESEGAEKSIDYSFWGL